MTDLAKRSKRKTWRRERAHLRVRSTLSGTAERPRLSVFKSLRHVYAQLIDDGKGVTRAAVSSLEPELKSQLGTGTGNVKRPSWWGPRCRAGEDRRHREGGLRPGVRVPRQGEGARRGGARKGIELLMRLTQTEMREGEGLESRVRLGFRVLRAGVNINRVTKVVKGGKNFSFSAWW